MTSRNSKSLFLPLDVYTNKKFPLSLFIQASIAVVNIHYHRTCLLYVNGKGRLGSVSMGHVLILVREISLPIYYSLSGCPYLYFIYTNQPTVKDEYYLISA